MNKRNLTSSEARFGKKKTTKFDLELGDGRVLSPFVFVGC